MWEKLKHIRPALQRHIDIQPRNYRGESWHVLHDKSSGNFHRLSQVAYHLLGLMDGHRSLEQILEEANTTPVDTPDITPPDQQDLIELLQYLYVADLLICDFPPNTQEMFVRQKNKKSQKWKRLLLNPLSWKISLGNPDGLLDRIAPVGRILCHPVTGILWLSIVIYSVLQVGAHWSELTSGQMAHLFSPTNMFLLWLTYPFLKVIHELGHALFTKAWGGTVTECGVVFVMGTPLPFVDATASTGFVKKSQRLMVSAAGMAVEIFIASFAFLLWREVEDGFFRSILFNLMVLGSVSTLIFNGNPLLKFDGYHLLCDLLEVPNLAARANEHIRYLIKRYGYGVPGIFSPAQSLMGAAGFTVYAVAAFFYRLFVLATIVFVAAKVSLTFACFLAAWMLFFQMLWPMIKYIQYLLLNEHLSAHRRRAIAVTSVSVVVLLIFLFIVPLPLTTKAEGVVWLPDDSQIRVQTSGEVARVLVKNGAMVEKGQVIIELKNPQLESALQVKQAMLAEYRARYEEVWSTDRMQSSLLVEDIQSIEGEVKNLQEKVAALTVKSPENGIVNFTTQYELMGSFFNQGDVAGYIVKPEPVNIRVALTQNEIGLVRKNIQTVKVKLAHDLSVTHRANVLREVPEGTFHLPSPALGVSGGGRLEIDSREGKDQKTEKMVFLLDVVLPDFPQDELYGERAYVLFRHPPEPVAQQIYRRLRQLFIRSLLY